MFVKPLLFAAALSVAPQISLAAGGETPTAPKPTQTTKECKKSKVWSEKKKRCVWPDNASLHDDTRYDAVREYAWAGQFDEAQTVLRAMTDQNSDRVLTYWGFTHRKLGDVDLGMTFYQEAIDKNPDNLLARSYMGQAYVEAGESYLAYIQLREIRNRGGQGTWPEESLAQAIRTGTTTSY